MTDKGASGGQVLAVGLPRAGKTTFMAALWHVLQAEDVPGALRLAHLSGDAKYLNSIASEWRQYRVVAGTHQQSEQLKIVMSLTDGQKSGFELVFPDLAGETFRHQWTDRLWSAEFDQLASQTTGLLVFAHPRMIEPLEIYEVRKLLPLEDTEKNEIVQGQLGRIDTPEKEPRTAKDESSSTLWDPAKAAEQVQLVDVLQSFLEKVGRKLRVSVVVSAWDLLKPTKYKLPETYLADKVAFLQQFLVSNPELLDYKTFGVSAIGGDLENPAEMTALLDMGASNRIQVVTESGTTHDITEPIKWALHWDPS